MRPGMLLRCLLLAGGVSLLAACGPKEPDTAGNPTAMRRLTEAQYRNVIADTFGPTITFGGRFDPLQRTDGLLALGDHAYKDFCAFGRALDPEV